jgi:antibiotic biosynthesis monooxygenase (ABM) superfamily enzyme
LTAEQSGEYFILLRFATQTDLEHWQASPETVAHLAEADQVSRPLPIMLHGLLLIIGTPMPFKPMKRL